MYDLVLAFTTLIFVAVSFWFMRSGYFSMFHPFTLYLAFHGFLFTFRPIVVQALNYREIYRIYQFTPTEAEKTRAILIATLALLSFAFFCFRQGNVAMRFHIDRVNLAERTWLMPSFLAAAAICGSIGFYSLIQAWHDANSGSLIASMAIDKATHIPINVSGNGYLAGAQLMLATCGAGLAWLYRFRILALLPITAFAVIGAGTGGRGAFVAALAMLALLRLFDQRRKLPSLPLLLGALLLIAAFSAVGEDRGRAIRQWFGTENTVGSTERGGNGWRPLEGMDFADLEFLEYVVHTVPQRTHTYSWFTEELQLFTEPIPRILWPEKPVGSPIQLYHAFDYGNPVGMTIPLPAVAWSGAGWAGVVMWCGLWGYGLGLTYRKFVTGPQTAFQVVAYMALMSSLIVGFRDGVLLTIAKQNLFFMAPIVLWLVFARWLGVPSTTDLRRLMAQRGEPSKDVATDRPPPGVRPTLPPAVARRRSALAARTRVIN